MCLGGNHQACRMESVSRLPHIDLLSTSLAPTPGLLHHLVTTDYWAFDIYPLLPALVKNQRKKYEKKEIPLHLSQ